MFSLKKRRYAQLPPLSCMHQAFSLHLFMSGLSLMDYSSLSFKLSGKVVAPLGSLPATPSHISTPHSQVTYSFKCPQSTSQPSLIQCKVE